MPTKQTPTLSAAEVGFETTRPPTHPPTPPHSVPVNCYQLQMRSKDSVTWRFDALILFLQLQAAFPAPPAADFQKWFPGLPASKTATDAPRWRVLCFPNAGNAEDMYTNEGTGVRRAPSPLLVSAGLTLLPDNNLCVVV